MGTIWIVCCYGTLPAEGFREYRCLQIARALAEKGYRVIWWTSSFDHLTKTQRSPGLSESGIDGVEIRLVRAPGYSDNVSFARIWSEWRFGRAFAERALREEAPKLVILGDPARFYGGPVARFAAACKAGLVVDVMDLWPELFEMLAPAPIRRIARVFLAPLYWQRNWLVRRAQAITAVTPDYADAVARAAGFQGPTHTAYCGWLDGQELPPDELSAVAASIQREHSDSMLVLYAGTLGNNYDVGTLTGAAEKLRHRNIRWIVAGSGPLEPLVRETMERLGTSQFTYLGLLSARTVAWLMQRCDVGLCCYQNGSTVSMPLKAFDYLHAGLPIISSLDRELGRIVANDGVGLHYQAGNADSLARAITDMAENPQRRQQFSGRAKEVAKRFEPSRQYRAYADFLTDKVLS